MTSDCSNLPFEARDAFQKRMPGFVPRVAMVLGSGLGALAEQISDAVTFSYADLPGFPISTVHGHAGELVAGRLAGVPVVCMKGRSHFYEGKGTAVMSSAIRTFKLLGCESIFLTCSAGSLRREVGPGQLVALTDHINTMPGNPLVGLNDERFGPRFMSMANAYDAGLLAILRDAAAELSVPWHEGVYVSYSGPSFETPAEIRMMQVIGGDVVGMSTVPEVITARHCGLKVTAVVTITNLAEGLSDFQLSHEQTLKYAAIGAKDLTRLIHGYLARIARIEAVAA
ncbi:xanthosine phosphorylase [Variovorax robiniae]|uniref:Purine nucleoside phosphorylase n=1 Tax=Variovorax robiniae TaxID=1836199 RepID=A0ABU8WZX7_9BURK